MEPRFRVNLDLNPVMFVNKPTWSVQFDRCSDRCFIENHTARVVWKNAPVGYCKGNDHCNIRDRSLHWSSNSRSSVHKFSRIVLILKDVVQSFGKIRYLVFIQDRGEGGGPGVLLGKLKYKIKRGNPPPMPPAPVNYDRSLNTYCKSGPPGRVTALMPETECTQWLGQWQCTQPTQCIISIDCEENGFDRVCLSVRLSALSCLHSNFELRAITSPRNLCVCLSSTP